MYQLLLARDLDYLQDEVHQQLDAMINEVKRMLNSFIQKLSQWLIANRYPADTDVRHNLHGSGSAGFGLD